MFSSVDIYGLIWNYYVNKISFGNVLTPLYDTSSSVLIHIMTQLCDVFSFVLMHIFIGKKGNKHDKEYYSLVKHDRFCLLFICLFFSLKPNSVLQSILLIVLSHWEKEVLFDKILSIASTERSFERSPPKTKHYKHEISYLENLTSTWMDK